MHMMHMRQMQQMEMQQGGHPQDDGMGSPDPYGEAMGEDQLMAEHQMYERQMLMQQQQQQYQMGMQPQSQYGY